jgi:hypothetical protein
MSTFSNISWLNQQELSWSRLYGRWNLQLPIQSVPIATKVWRCIQYKIMLPVACWWLAAGRWFSLDTPVSSTNKTDRYNITEILMNVVKYHTSRPKLNWISIVLALWNNSLWVDVLLHSFQANQSLLLLLKATCLKEQQLMSILYSLVWLEPTVKVSTLAITPPMKTKSHVNSVWHTTWRECYKGKRTKS